MRPRNVSPLFLLNRSISMLISMLISNLLIQTIAGTPKCSASWTTRSISCTPDTEGSVTISTASAPPMEAITGQPTPGGPSVSMRSRFFASASFWASFRTRVTSFPEFSSAMPSRAWTMGPNRVSEINHSPQVSIGKSIASSGQK